MLKSAPCAADTKAMTDPPSITVPLDKVATSGHSFVYGGGMKVWVEADGSARVCDSLPKCQDCGEHLICDYDAETGTISTMTFKEVTEGGRYEQVDEPCAYDPELETVTVLHVPSGRIVVDDDLRDAYEGNFVGSDYNSFMGQARTVERYAEVGVAYGPVMNTSPALYHTPQGYAIANPALDERTGEREAPKGWTKLASIHTGLWAYSVADYEAFLAIGGRPIEEHDNDGSRSVVEVEPGDYEFTLHTGRADFDCHGEGDVVFATIRKIA